MAKWNINFLDCGAITRLKGVKVSDVLATNKIVKFVLNAPSYITIPILGLISVKVHLFSEASFKRGCLVLLGDRFHNTRLISWSSTKMKCVTRSTAAAETTKLAIAKGKCCCYCQLERD